MPDNQHVLFLCFGENKVLKPNKKLTFLFIFTNIALVNQSQFYEAPISIHFLCLLFHFSFGDE